MTNKDGLYGPLLAGAVIVAVVLVGIGHAWGYSSGADMAVDVCKGGISEVAEACKRNMDELNNTCNNKIDELQKVLCDEIPSVQQDRIFKWEVCFIDENCHACLHMTHEGGSPSGDVEWCFQHAWDEMQPGYEVPDPYIPGYEL